MKVDPTGTSFLGFLLGIIISVAISLISETIADLIDDGEINRGWQSYAGAAVSGIIAGLGCGLVGTMITGGLGDVAYGLFTGQISNIGDVITSFSKGAIVSGVSFGIAKGVTKSLAKTKVNKIIGNSTKNSVINKKFAEAGYKNIKIGRDGIKGAANKILKTFKYEAYNILADGISNLAANISIIFGHD